MAGVDPEAVAVQEAAQAHADMQARRRVSRARDFAAAVNLLKSMHPTDAALLCCRYLDANGAGMPEVTEIRSSLRADAEWWALCAHPHELVGYGTAALRRLRGAGDAGALSEAMIKEVLVALWEGLPEADRRAFLARVDPRGRFQRVG
jgi:hypothetical protein